MHCMVIGANSYIGSELFGHLKHRGHSVWGTTRRDPPGKYMFCDLAAVHPIIYLPTAGITFFCAGITRFTDCEEAPELAHRINVASPNYIASDIVKRGGNVVMLSSSAVETHPESVYGRLKREGEANFLNYGDRASVLRFCPVMKTGRHTYDDGPYHPVTLGVMVEKLISLCSQWKPGLQRVLAC